MKLEYYRPIQTREDYILSIDKMLVDYIIASPSALSALGRKLAGLEIEYAVKVTHWESYKIGTFKGNYTIGFQNGNSFWLGQCLNGARPEYRRVRIEFNPNKCAKHRVFMEILQFMNEHSRTMHREVKRYDLAIDIPVERRSAKLIKDRRVYTERQHGAEWTEYLGAKSSTVGRVKLYNKQVEAGLSYPLTRLEITLDPGEEYEKVAWPQVYYIENQQIGVQELSVTETDRFIVGALLSGYGQITDLGRRMQEKVKSIMKEYVRYVKIAEGDYKKIIGQLNRFLEYPRVDLEIGRVDEDQPVQAEKGLPEWVRKAAKVEDK